MRGRVVVAVLALVAFTGSAPGAWAVSRPAVPILMYHHIARAPAGARIPALWVTPAAFSSHVRALQRSGYRGVTLERVWSAWNGGPPLPRHPVVVSFDDGYADQVGNALPALRRARWPGVLNLALDYLPAMGGAAAVRRLLAESWELDSHSITHADLTKLAPARLRAELVGSRTRIRSLFGVTPRFFCYPFGHLDATVIAAVRRAGYLAATTTRAGYAQPDDTFRLARLQVSRGMSAAGLRARLRALRPHQFRRSTSMAWPMPPATHIDSMPY